MSTVAIKNTMVMKVSLVERFKKYLLDNAEYFAAASAMMTGNGYAAGQIMRDARCVAASNRQEEFVGHWGREKRIFLRPQWLFLLLLYG